MKYAKNLRQAPVPFALTSCLLGVLLASGCASEGGTGIIDSTGAVAGQTSEAGAGDSGSKGGSSTSGSGNVEDGGQPHETGGTGGKAPQGEAGAQAGGGAPPTGEGGAHEEPVDMGGAGGAPNDDGVQIAPRCIFHTEAPPPEVGAGGAGSDPTPNVVSQVNPFLGAYLTDSAGRTLYTYGADLPGDCQTPPQSTCVADCLVSWPIFDAGARVLGAGLKDDGFGSIVRPDGATQTTYMGWPLYYYKSDLTLGQLTGQGKGKTWHVAEVALPSIVIMKLGTLKYLGDAGGHTLYVSAADQVGSATSDPVSTCSGDCLDTFEPFHEKNYSAVTSLESFDFEVFSRQGKGGLQLSYKGQPLYRAATDVKSGDMTGTAIQGFTAAVP